MNYGFSALRDVGTRLWYMSLRSCGDHRGEVVVYDKAGYLECLRVPKLCRVRASSFESFGVCPAVRTLEFEGSS